MLDIEDLEYQELKAGHRELAEREREMERAALLTLQHHPVRHALRLCAAAIGFKLRPTDEEDHTAEDPQTA